MDNLDDRIRGGGRTRRQMEAAPRGAIFIWCTEDTFYPRDLARALDRRDLKITTQRNARETLIGRRHTVVVDHAVSDEDVARLRPYIDLANRGDAHAQLKA